MPRILSCLIALCLMGVPVLGQSAAPQGAARDVSATQGDAKAIQQIEDDWLQGERTTDVSVIERVLADDYVSLNPWGFGPSKTDLLEHLRPRTGQAPPYTLQTENMHIYILDNVAFASFTKTYTAKENGRVQREDNTHIFRKENGAWKLKISRPTLHSAE